MLTWKGVVYALFRFPLRHFKFGRKRKSNSWQQCEKCWRSNFVHDLISIWTIKKEFLFAFFNSTTEFLRPNTSTPFYRYKHRYSGSLSNNIFTTPPYFVENDVFPTLRWSFFLRFNSISYGKLVDFVTIKKQANKNKSTPFYTRMATTPAREENDETFHVNFVNTVIVISLVFNRQRILYWLNLIRLPTWFSPLLCLLHQHISI